MLRNTLLKTFVEDALENITDEASSIEPDNNLVYENILNNYIRKILDKEATAYNISLIYLQFVFEKLSISVKGYLGLFTDNSAVKPAL